MGDGLAQIVAGFVGGPPVTSYGENIGVSAITRVQCLRDWWSRGVRSFRLCWGN